MNTQISQCYLEAIIFQINKRTPKLCSNANEVSHVVYWNGRSPLWLGIWHTKYELNAYMAYEMCWFGQWHSLWKTKQPIILNLYIPICVEFEWNSDKSYIVYGIRYRRDTYLVNIRNYPSLTIQIFVKFCSTVWYKRPVWEFELRGDGDCGLVNGYFIFIDCYISHIRSLW